MPFDQPYEGVIGRTLEESTSWWPPLPSTPSGAPNIVIVGPDGKIVYEGAIDSKATPNPADIPTSTNYVKAALDEALGGKPVSNAQTRPYGCHITYKSS